jgi:hypothetical protein
MSAVGFLVELPDSTRHFERSEDTSDVRNLLRSCTLAQLNFPTFVSKLRNFFLLPTSDLLH